MTAANVIFIYAVFVLVGGLLGYQKARSRVSLASGLVSGIALILLGRATEQGRAWGEQTALALAFALMVVFMSRWRKTGKFMPGGLMTIVSVLAFGAIAGAMRGI